MFTKSLIDNISPCLCIYTATVFLICNLLGETSLKITNTLCCIIISNSINLLLILVKFPWHSLRILLVFLIGYCHFLLIFFIIIFIIFLGIIIIIVFGIIIIIIIVILFGIVVIVIRLRCILLHFVIIIICTLLGIILLLGIIILFGFIFLGFVCIHSRCQLTKLFIGCVKTLAKSFDAIEQLIHLAAHFSISLNPVLLSFLLRSLLVS